MMKKSTSSENEPCWSKDCKKNTETLNKKITDLEDKLFDAKNMIFHYKLECIETLKKKLETLQQEKEGIDGKLASLLITLKDLDNLIESQRSDKNKEGLGYSVVPPPIAQIYSSPNKYLSRTGLPEFADDTVTDYSRPSPTVESTSKDDQNRNPFVSETVASPITPKPFIKFVKPKDSQSESKTYKKETPKKPPIKVKKSFTPKPIAYRPQVRPVRTNMNGARPNRTSFNKQAHLYENKPFHRTSAGRSHYRAPWVPAVNKNFPTVNRKLPTGNLNVSTVCCCCSRHVNTARPKVVINRRNWVNDVKASGNSRKKLEDSVRTKTSRGTRNLKIQKLNIKFKGGLLGIKCPRVYTAGEDYAVVKDVLNVSQRVIMSQSVTPSQSQQL
uniref:Uncharacterized protein n=1 Tax=Tanacetum cinerariifolium TaxID=118510 RepID=A0A699ID84_TANCI|nr:hypothetical protein [Tanacetum cinerariifolium]